MNARRAEFRAFARDSEIAARDKLAACGGRDTLDCGNDGLGQAHNLLHHCAATPENIDKIGAAPVRIGAADGHFLQIMACAEYGACRGKDDSADGAIFCNPVKHSSDQFPESESVVVKYAPGPRTDKNGLTLKWFDGGQFPDFKALGLPEDWEGGEQGKGVVDMLESRAARKETAAWWELLRWIDEQPKTASDRGSQSLRNRPLAAGRRVPSERTLRA